MKIKKGLKWVLAAIVLWIVAKAGMTIYGVFHHTLYFRHPMGLGFGGHGMRGHHHIGFFHFIQPLVSVAFWIVVIVILAGWLMKKMNSRRVSHSLAAIPTTDSSHLPYSAEADFLDEWEKNQTNPKENE